MARREMGKGTLEILICGLMENHTGALCLLGPRAWSNISKYGYLTEAFIRKFTEYVNWDIVSRYQKLSKSFIEEFANYINQEQLLLNEHVPAEFKDKPSEYMKFIEEIFKNN